MVSINGNGNGNGSPEPSNYEDLSGHIADEAEKAAGGIGDGVFVPTKRGRGRPTIRNDVMDAVIYRAFGMGLGINSTAALVGISPTTLKDWKKKDQVFAANIDRAKSEKKARAVGRLLDMQGHANPFVAFAALKWWMSQRMKLEFGPKVADEQDVTQPDLRYV